MYFRGCVRPDAELFPIFLKLAGRPVLLVGGGVVASSKMDALAPTGAHVTVVAPLIADSIRATAATLHERPFEERDLDGQWLVISAAPPEVNRAVADAAERRRVFVNAVDDPNNASAYLGGVLRRDGLTLSISTSGRAPALAGLIREGLDALIPQDLDRWFARADEMKAHWRSTGVPMDERRPQLMDALMKLYDDRSAALADVDRSDVARPRVG